MLKIPNSVLKPITDVYTVPETSSSSCNTVENGARSIGRGGGLLIQGGAVKLNFVQGIIGGNKVVKGFGGGGVALLNAREISMIDVSIVDNEVTINPKNADATGMGGGIFSDSSLSITVSGDVQRNKVNAQEHGAGLHSIKSIVTLTKPTDFHSNVGGTANVVAKFIPFPQATCPPGMYFFDRGVDPWGDLLSLDANSRGNSICQDCPKGQYTDQSGSSTCKLCLPGQYSDSVRQTTCKRCAVDFKTNLTGSSACEPCGVGTGAKNRGSVQCVPCTAGSAGTPCSDCVPGKFRSGGVLSGKYYRWA